MSHMKCMNGGKLAQLEKEEKEEKSRVVNG